MNLLRGCGWPRGRDFARRPWRPLRRLVVARRRSRLVSAAAAADPALPSSWPAAGPGSLARPRPSGTGRSMRYVALRASSRARTV